MTPLRSSALSLAALHFALLAQAALPTAEPGIIPTQHDRDGGDCFGTAEPPVAYEDHSQILK